MLTELIIRLCNDFPTTEREVREFEERTRMQHAKLDEVVEGTNPNPNPNPNPKPKPNLNPNPNEVVEGMLGSSLGRNMTSAEREQMKTMFQKQAPHPP